MLILIAGISGTMGQLLAHEALKRGHKLRGLGRSKSKLPENIQNDARIEFVETASYFDDDVLEQACRGCDAVICAYGVVPTLQLEGQLFLLRAAERAGVDKFVSASWNADYRKLQLGDMETYDPYMCFRAQAQLESAINPLYLFVGAFAETLFQSYHPDTVNVSWWLNERREVHTWGTGDELLTVTPMRDSAAYTICLLEREDAAEGGDWLLYSFQCSIRQAAVIFEKATGQPKEIVIKGSIGDLEKMEAKERANGSKLNYWEYMISTYWVNLLSGKFEWGADSQNDEFPDECRTSLESWFIANVK